MVRCPECGSIYTNTLIARMDKKGFYHKLNCSDCGNEWITTEVN